MSNYVQLTSCVACGNSKLHTFLDLGKQQLANNYHDGGGGGEQYPLALNVCEKCWHTQLTVSVNPITMFENYVYVTGTSKTLRDYCDWFAEKITQTHSVGSVLDIACNDGTQLDSFKQLGWDTYGVDPAKNLYSQCADKGHNVTNCFWPTNLYRKFDVIVAQNVCAHTPTPHMFLTGIKNALNPNGTAFIQTSQSQMYQRNEFDTTYHEHISFFSVNSMKKMAELAGLTLTNVAITPIHGDSYVFELKHNNHKPNANVYAQIKKEIAQGRHNLEFYYEFGHNAHDILDKLATTVDNLIKNNITVIGYGAAAKGMTVLQAKNIKLDYIIDDNPLKQGLHTPGTNIPITSRQSLASHNHCVVIPLAWNFFDEIKQNIEEIRGQGKTTYIKYFPELEIID